MNRPKDVKTVAMVKDEVKLTLKDGEVKRPRLEMSSDGNEEEDWEIVEMLLMGSDKWGEK